MASVAGTWRLAEWTGHADAVGLLILTEDGWYAVDVAGPKGVVTAEAGSYDVEDDNAVMTSEVALTANTVGIRRPRQWRVQGDILELQWDDTPTRWHRARDEVVDSMGG